MEYSYTALVTFFALAVYFWTNLKVGGARAKYEIAAPATTGNPDFERVFRVHLNTLEQLAIFLPVLWLFALTYGDMWAAIIGVVWPCARILYARGYYEAAEKRGLGFGVSFLVTALLFLGALTHVIRDLL